MSNVISIADYKHTKEAEKTGRHLLEAERIQEAIDYLEEAVEDTEEELQALEDRWCEQRWETYTDAQKIAILEKAGLLRGYVRA